jgi:LPS sulfotransferase NodH
MTAPFDYFVVFADMRTGSNLLESNINSFAGFECFGEAFNPNFVGYPNKTEMLGITLEMREADPLQLIEKIKVNGPALGGFRYFNDHDPRVFETCLHDPRCAKIILTRNPVDSYVSLKIARETGQWKLTNVKRRKDSKISFDADEFERYFAQLQAFQQVLKSELQTTGQTAFYLTYDDLRSLEMINGLARYLGSDERLEALDSTLKKQNPGGLKDKVSNYADMQSALMGFDRFDISRTPTLEPGRGPAVPRFVLAAQAPLLYMPIQSGPYCEVGAWMAALDDADRDDLLTGLNQQALRQWKQQHPKHRSFTVLRHPVARAHQAFCEKILQTGPGSYPAIRKKLRNFYKLPLPGRLPDANYDLGTHQQAFIAFLEFLRANLAGQTSVRVDVHWASQTTILQGMAHFCLPDVIIREPDMQKELPALARQIGIENATPPHAAPDDNPFALKDIYNDKIEALAKSIYQRDYLMFGFQNWG